MQPIEMTQTDGFPTVVIPTGDEDSEKFLMIGEFPNMEQSGVILVQSNGEGGMDVKSPDAQTLLECLAADLGYDLVKSHPPKSSVE